MRGKLNKSMKWSWFKVPVKVEQVTEYLFSDTVQSRKTKTGSGEISQGQYRWYPSECSLGQVQTKVEKKNERDEFLVFFGWKRVGEMARGDVEDNGANWRSSEGRRFHKAWAVW